MKITHYKNIIGAALGLFAACSDDVTTPAFTVGEDNNTIVLSAGVGDSHKGIMSRGVDSNHSLHTPFTVGTKLALSVEGTWLGHTPEAVVQNTTATIGDVTGAGSKHNAVVFTAAEQLYWDDYGTADPANMPDVTGNGREKGLTIYGAAIDGVTTAAPTVSDWESITWELPKDQTGGWAEKDLLTSNNIRAQVNPGDGADGTYKFDDWKNGDVNTSDLLQFTHAMAKVTVNLTAAEGFPGHETSVGNAKFQQAPKVTLLGFNYKGSVNVKTKASTATTSTVDDIVAYRAGAWTQSHTAQYTALVFPGNTFADNKDVLKIEADGNTYYVTAAKINAKMQEVYATSSTDFRQAYNYIFNITVKKTGVVVAATVTNWVDVNSEEESPKINVTKTYGHEPGTDFGKGFDLYRSTTLTGSYLGDGDHSVVSFADSKYTMTPQLYWPTHSTHYFFRGVWPRVGSTEGPAAAKVHDNTIDVENVAYKQGYYPSDLMIGRPLTTDETATDEACKVHSNTNGICATEGDVRMNFRYMMSQVKVELSSSNPTDKDYIAFDANTKVEIIGGYKDGAIKLSDCTSDFTGKSVAPYMLHNAAAADYDSYRDAIIPQALTDGLKFRITVKNSDDTYDTYEAVVKNIKVSEGGATPALINAWQSGKIYTYTLKVTKTAVNVIATLTDWITVTASENVWF